MNATTSGQTIGDVLTETAALLGAAGIEDGRRESRLLVALALGVEASVVLGYPERPIDAETRERLKRFVTRRVAREPLSRLAGRRGFWRFDFALSPDTLDPRPDSETLIEAVLDLLPNREAPRRFIDFGTGTGCLLLTLLAEFPGADGIGVDIAPGAIDIARLNAASLGVAGRVQFVVGDWGKGFSGTVDVFISNPPYIPSDEIAGLAPEVALYEPRRALDGGGDGLDAYRRLAGDARRLLRPGGLAFFEVGAGQAQPVTVLMGEAGLTLHTTRRDLAGIERCVVVRAAG